MSIEETDKVCDLHFAYMGYGKFARITPINSSVSTNNVLLTMKTLTISKPATCEEPAKTPITRNRHGAHPSQTTSAHINYYNLNQGQDLSEKRSPPACKPKTINERSLREPTASRLAAQSHIIQNKNKQRTATVQRTATEITEDEVSVVAMLSPDEDGTPFTRLTGIHGEVIGTALKIETKHDEMDEQPTNIKEEKVDSVIKNEKDEPLSQIQPDMEQEKPSSNKHIDDPIIEKVLYTHAHRHTCTRKNCNPIILSKKGIVKPNRPSTTHYHLGGACSEGGQKLLPPEPELKTPKTEDTTEHEEDEHQEPPETTSIPTTTMPSDHTTQPKLTDSTNEKDEHTLEAAGGLLMLQNIDTAGNVDTINEYDPYDNSTLVPLIGEYEKDEHMKTSISLTTTVKGDTDLPALEQDAPLTSIENEESSDDTIIYEPPRLDNDTPQSTIEITPSKGTLTIREVGIPKPGTSTDQTPTDVMPVITTAGKVQCYFCKRAFNTITEQKQHMARRHLAQLQEKKERLRRKTDTEKQEVQDTDHDCTSKPDQEQITKTEKVNKQKRKRESEKDEHPNERKKKKSKKSSKESKPQSRNRTPSKNSSERTRNRKSDHEKDEQTKSKEKNKERKIQHKVHTKRRHINRRHPKDCNRTYNCQFCDKFMILNPN